MIVRCWEKQRRTLEVKNFDLLVKSAIQRALLSQLGREYCLKRGRFAIPFLSELGSETEEPEVDFENALFRDSEEGSYEQIGLEQLIQQISCQLTHPRLRRTFDCIVTDHSYDMAREDHTFENLNPDCIRPEARRRIAIALAVSEHQLVADLQDIRFVMQGFQHIFSR